MTLDVDNATPTGANVIAGNAGGPTVQASGFVDVTSASMTFSEPIAGLSPTTAYDIWIAAVDDGGNQQPYCDKTGCDDYCNT